MLKASVLRTGLPVSLIEMSNVAVAIVSDPKYKVSCSLFYDREDVRPMVCSSAALLISWLASSQGSLFGRLLASEILRAFVDVRVSAVSASCPDQVRP
jgi:hypothetical protein